MQAVRALIIVLFLMSVAGCSGQITRESVYHGIYDGIRTANMRGTIPAENATKPDPSYDQYAQQRKEILKRDTQ